MREHVREPDEFERLPHELRDAVALLRDEPVVDRAWRTTLLRRAAAERRAPRRLSLSWPAGIAAALVFMVAGGTMATFAVGRPSGPPNGVPNDLPRAASTQVLPVRFTVEAPAATSVSIVGDFNRWTPGTLPMRRSADGRVWEVEVRLPVGHYSYAFMIDGRLSADPNAPRGADDDFGKPNSVLMVRGS